MEMLGVQVCQWVCVCWGRGRERQGGATSQLPGLGLLFKPLKRNLFGSSFLFKFFFHLVSTFPHQVFFALIVS